MALVPVARYTPALSLDACLLHVVHAWVRSTCPLRRMFCLSENDTSRRPVCTRHEGGRSVGCVASRSSSLSVPLALRRPHASGAGLPRLQHCAVAGQMPLQSTTSVVPARRVRDPLSCGWLVQCSRCADTSSCGSRSSMRTGTLSCGMVRYLAVRSPCLQVSLTRCDSSLLSLPHHRCQI